MKYKNLAAELARRGMSKKDLVEELSKRGVKISYTTLWRIMCGKSKISLKEALVMAEIFEVSPKYLFEEEV